jgi:exodeoxyribonuclease VII large subunit
VTADGALQRLIAVQTHRAKMKLGRCAGRLDTLSPLGVLSRGYAVCWTEDRTRAIRDAADVSTGDTVHVTLSRGAITAKVSGTE